MTDRTRTGSRLFTPQEYQRVVAYVRSMPQEIGNDELSRILGIGGRTIRAILSEADGHEFVLNVSDAGVGLAETADDAEAGTRRMKATAMALLERCERRERWASENLERVQQRMWG